MENRKIYVIVNGDISFRTTAGEIRDGVGSASKFNGALRDALERLEGMEKGNGLVSSFSGYNIQISY